MTTLLNIKIHETYYHKYYGKVKVLKIEKNQNEETKLTCGSYIVHFRDKEFDLEDWQCINDFKMAVS